MKYPLGRILLFARSPVLGKVKTRLAQSIGEEKALQVHKKLMASVAECCVNAQLCPVELWLSEPVEQDCFIAELCQRYQLALEFQRGKNLGDRMSNAVNKVLQQHEFTVIVGADCPAISVAYLEQAVSSVAIKSTDKRVVIGPAEDGGYVLIGLRHSEHRLFSGIDWGSDRVWRQTKTIASQMNWSIDELPTLWDVDRFADYQRLLQLDSGWQI